MFYKERGSSSWPALSVIYLTTVYEENHYLPNWTAVSLEVTLMLNPLVESYNQANFL